MASILHVIPYFVPAYGFGGPVTACLDIASTQVAMGHRVAVLTTDALDASTRVESPHDVVEGIEVFRFRNVSARLSKRHNLFLPRRLLAWVREHLREFDVVHLHDYFTYQNVIVGKWCRRYGVPYVIQPHGVAVPPPDQRLYLVKLAFGALWGRALLRGARTIIAVSEVESAKLDRYLPDCRAKIAVVHNGLRFAAELADPGARDSLGLKATDRVILSLGRLHHTKGFDRLIRGFARLVARDDRYRLLIAGSDNGGEGALRELIEQLGLRDRVHLLGLVLGADKARAFAVADVFALLSRYESFAIAVVEALSQGLPVLLSRDVGVAAQLMPLGCAMLARDPDDAEATADDLERLFTVRADLAAHARPAAARYDIRSVVETLEQHYGIARDSALDGP